MQLIRLREFPCRNEDDVAGARGSLQAGRVEAILSIGSIFALGIPLT